MAAPPADPHVILDFKRRERIGVAEAIFCAGKTHGHLVTILEQAAAVGQPQLLTRLLPHVFDKLPAELRDQIDYESDSHTGFFGEVPAPADPAKVAVVSAGTSDVGVAREAQRTLYFAGADSRGIFDVGVAGIWRLMDRVDDIRSYPIVIAVAGMDAALVSVLGGLVAGCLIAVPTSAGYGRVNNGETALNSALVSCAPGVTVVNIDNGYGAACAALRILNVIRDNSA